MPISSYPFKSLKGGPLAQKTLNLARCNSQQSSMFSLWLSGWELEAFSKSLMNLQSDFQTVLFTQKNQQFGRTLGSTVGRVQVWTSTRVVLVDEERLDRMRTSGQSVSCCQEERVSNLTFIIQQDCATGHPMVPVQNAKASQTPWCGSTQTTKILPVVTWPTAQILWAPCDGGWSSVFYEWQRQ